MDEKHWDRRQALSWLGGIVGTSMFPHATAWAGAEGATPPNLVLVMTDDQGPWALGCYGNSEIVTPNIDRLAAGGTLLSNSYSTIPVCSPSRATFLTGLIPSQHGIHDWISKENQGERARSLVERFVTLPDVLAQHGYTNGLVGKWHLGDNSTPFRNHDEWYCIPTGGSRYNDARVSDNGTVIETKGYLTDRITDRAVQFIRKNRDRPFFANIQYNAPHGPWSGHPQRFLDLYKDCGFDSLPKEPLNPWASVLHEHIGKRETLAQYFAAISAVDDAVGRIVKTLEELGLRENTIVMFMSDQGFQCGHNGLFGKGNCSNPRNMFEESVRIPHVVNWPGRVPSGQMIDALIGGYDFMPTILELAGAPMPDGRYAGRSYAPMLLGERQDWEDAVYGEYGRARMIRTTEWKLVHRADGGPHELYHLRTDPGEDLNLAGEPSAREELRRLRKRLFQWFAEYANGDADPVGYEYLHPDRR